jgi:hypothetical protein
MLKNIFLICVFNLLAIDHAVTYEITPGRFGDNLLNYMHAKWISYKYQIPLLYKPFIFSNKLIMHENEIKYENQYHKFDKKIMLSESNKIDLTINKKILYIVPYFPETFYEINFCKNYEGGKWYYFDTDWKDNDFRKILSENIKPNYEIKDKIQIPANSISVALHIRTGGTFDDNETIKAFPLKFVNNEFYFQEIEFLIKHYINQKIFIHIFTDDMNTLDILNIYKKKFNHKNIMFNIRKLNNNHESNILEDFFAMLKFDCLVHSESNYSLTASFLGNFKYKARPTFFEVNKNKIIYKNILREIIG